MGQRRLAVAFGCSARRPALAAGSYGKYIPFARHQLSQSQDACLVDPSPRVCPNDSSATKTHQFDLGRHGHVDIWQFDLGRQGHCCIDLGRLSLTDGRIQ